MLQKKFPVHARLRVLKTAAAVAAACSTSAVMAQSVHPAEQATELAPVVVTGNPLGSGLLDLVSPTSVMNNREISQKGASTLGETLNGIPGVSASNFGPNASRPIIRGLDADRIKIMQNGVGVLDVSGLSADHAVPIDPLVIEQLEVVRGPAALLYGGSAVGGVVNAVDNRIPQDAIDGTSGRYELHSGGASKESSGSAVLETGNGTLAIHADGFQRTTEDLKIPGFARSEQRRAQSPQANEAYGYLPNSSSKSDGGALGASLTFDRGYAGLSYSSYNSNYGTVAEPDVRIQMKSERVDFAGEMRDLGSVISKVKVRYAHTDYQHQEIEGGAIGTTFNNKGDEASIEATHGKLGPLNGVIGLQFHNSNFSALGDEALVPQTNTKSRAAYMYEEWPLDKLKLTFGGRIESVDISSAGGGPDDPNNPGTPRFGAAEKRTFTPRSAAAGGLYTLSDTLSVATNFSHTERAPSYNELFANGPHPATGQYELGNKDLNVEKSNGIDMQLRWRKGPHSASIGAFYTRFQNYISLFNTGNTRAADGLINPVTDGLPEAQLVAVPAQFSGLEAESKFHVYEGTGDLDLRFKADYVRASNRNTGEPLPRIAPYHLGVGLDYKLGDFGARLDAMYAGKQNRVAANELPTDSYTLVNALLSYKIRSQLPSSEVFLKASNLLNQEIRLSTSVLKDISPMGGRTVMIGLRGSF
ncbi:MAG TPA: TonB-dependent receptor [Rhodocyclaceae bacterium]|nr:TonB-dependent receptor [Rhodocyclaceae bacterium]